LARGPRDNTQLTHPSSAPRCLHFGLELGACSLFSFFLPWCFLPSQKRKTCVSSSLLLLPGSFLGLGRGLFFRTESFCTLISLDSSMFAVPSRLGLSLARRRLVLTCPFHALLTCYMAISSWLQPTSNSQDDSDIITSSSSLISIALSQFLPERTLDAILASPTPHPLPHVFVQFPSFSTLQIFQSKPLSSNFPTPILQSLN
jgi:hypothetical protein